MESSAQRGSPRGDGRFTTLRRIGEGGFGVVYEVLDTQRNAVVALKTLARKDPAVIYRLKQEFRALCDLSHPNLVQLHELFLTDDDCFFTMEYVDGCDVLDYVRGTDGPFDDTEARRALAAMPTTPLSRSGPPFDRPFGGGPGSTYDATGPVPTSREQALQPVAHSLGPLSQAGVERLFRVLPQLCDALAALHERGILHRDIKPSNILVTPEGKAVLLDFGLAFDTTRLAPEQSEMLVGTPAYMAPEQIRGDEMTPATDIYALGALIYELLVGLPPFTGNTMQILSRKQVRVPTAPISIHASVPEALSHLCMRMLALDPAARPTAHEVRDALLDRPSPVRLGPSSRDFFGREAELLVLERELDHVRRRREISVVAISAQSGMGKSLLVKHFLERSGARHPDTVILRGRCYEQESVPHKALDSLVDAVSRHLRRLPTAEAFALLPRDVWTLSRVFPVLGQVPAVQSAPVHRVTTKDVHELKRRAFGALRELLGRIGDRRPLIVFIDDLQWGDADGGPVIADMLRPPDAPPMLFVMAYRTDDAHGSPCLEALLPALAREHAEGTRFAQLELGTLSPEDARALSRSVLGADATDELLERVVQEAAGRPFYLRELSSFARERGALDHEGSRTGPVSIDALVKARLAQLPEEARSLLTLVALASQPIARAAAAQAAELDPGRELAAYERLRAESLLRARVTHQGDVVETYHDRIREAVTRELSTATRQKLHARLALALEAQTETDDETLAVHYHAAGNTERALHYAERAAEQAASSLAFERAARLYRLCLTLSTSDPSRKTSLNERLGIVLLGAGRGAEAASHLLEAARAADDQKSVELKRTAAEQLLVSGHMRDGVTTLKDVLSRVSIRLPGPAEAVLRVVLLRLWMLVRRYHFRRREVSEVPPEDLLRVDTAFAAAKGFGLVDTLIGGYFSARQLHEALSLGEPYRVARAMIIEAAFGAVRGGRAAGRNERIVRRIAQELTDELERPYLTGLLETAFGVSEVLRGRYDVACTHFERAEPILLERCTGIAWELSTLRLFHMRALARRGAWASLRERLPRLLDDASARGDRYARATLGTCVGHFPALLDDEPERADEALSFALEAWGRDMPAFRIQHYHMLLSRTDVLLYRDTGVGDAALSHVEQMLPGFDRSKFRWMQSARVEVLQARVRAELAAAAAASGPARKRLLARAEHGIIRLLREDVPWAIGLAHLYRGSLFAMRGEAKDALTALAEAEHELLGIDMQAHVGAARHRRASLLGGEEREERQREVERDLEARGASAPQRVVAMLAPGVFEARASMTPTV